STAEVTALAQLAGIPITDTNGTPIDGEFSGTFPSGNGTSGGDFVATLYIRPPPVASNANYSVHVNNAVNVPLSVTSALGSTLTYTIVAPQGHGLLSGSAPNLIYTPANGYSGSDSFTFKANDGTSNSNI